jgi:hypothetical protein
MGSDSLAAQFDVVTAARRTLTVYAEDPHPEVADHFEGWNVEVRFDRLPEGSTDGFVTVRRGEEFLGSLDVRVLDALLEPPASVGPPGETTGPPLENLLALLDGTTFRSFDRRQLLAVSREIEDRAWRIGTGRLHAGFQRPPALAAQRDAYERLADRGLDAHVYFDGAWDADPIEGVTLHTGTDGQLGRFWFVVLAATGEQDCALLAMETDDRYDGFWTYDPDHVADIDGLLRDRYW